MPWISDLPGLNAIRVGDLYLKPQSVEDMIARSCRALFLEAETPDLPLGRRGTVTLLRLGDRRYAVATRHQLCISSDADPQRSIVDTVRIASTRTIDGRIVSREVV